MAKNEKKNEEVATLEKSEVATTETNTISNEEAANKLKAATLGDQDSGYLKFGPGDKVRVVYKGAKDIPSLDKVKAAAGEKTKAIVFVTDKGKEQICADVAIRSYFEKQDIGCAREIVCKGMTKGPNGEYRAFDFFELNIAQ